MHRWIHRVWSWQNIDGFVAGDHSRAWNLALEIYCIVRGVNWPIVERRIHYATKTNAIKIIPRSLPFATVAMSFPQCSVIMQTHPNLSPNPIPIRSQNRFRIWSCQYHKANIWFKKHNGAWDWTRHSWIRRIKRRIAERHLRAGRWWGNSINSILVVYRKW